MQAPPRPHVSSWAGMHRHGGNARAPAGVRRFRGRMRRRARVRRATSRADRRVLGLMPDHFHALVELGEGSLSQAIGSRKARTAAAVNRVRGTRCTGMGGGIPRSRAATMTCSMWRDTSSAIPCAQGWCVRCVNIRSGMRSGCDDDRAGGKIAVVAAPRRFGSVGAATAAILSSLRNYPANFASSAACAECGGASPGVRRV
jgi:hypothetical protein